MQWRPLLKQWVSFGKINPFPVWGTCKYFRKTIWVFQAIITLLPQKGFIFFRKSKYIIQLNYFSVWFSVVPRKYFSVRSTFSPSFYYFSLPLVIEVDSFCRRPAPGLQEHCGWLGQLSRQDSCAFVAVPGGESWCVSSVQEEEDLGREIDCL